MILLKNEDLPRLDLIKCDTEGSELLVFQGARDLIERFKPIVLTEIDASNLARYQQKPSDIIDFFQRVELQAHGLGGWMPLSRLQRRKNQAIIFLYRNI